jgi:glycosyltransferase involved in cell wall biosynthesis
LRSPIGGRDRALPLLLASDEALRKRLSAAGRLRAQGFTWEACAHITQNALRDARNSTPQCA